MEKRLYAAIEAKAKQDDSKPDGLIIRLLKVAKLLKIIKLGYET